MTNPEATHQNEAEGDPCAQVAGGQETNVRKSQTDAACSNLALLFSPLGSQTLAGKNFYECGEHQAFHEAMQHCYLLYKRYISITADDDDIGLKKFYDAVFEPAAHPSEWQLVWMFVLQYSLYAQLQAQGIRPKVVLGHSNGEYAAAVAAGHLSLEHAMRLLITRAESLSKGLSGAENGCMASVKASFEDVVQALQGFKSGDSQVVVAAINSPYDTVVSGPSNEAGAGGSLVSNHLGLGC